MDACIIDPLATQANAYCALQTEPLQSYASIFYTNHLNLAVLAGSLIVAFALLIPLRSKVPLRAKMALLYAHVGLLIFPFVFILFNQGCQQRIYHCGLSTFAFGIPALMIGIAVLSLMVGYFAIPLLLASNRISLADHPSVRRIQEQATQLGWKAPEVYAIDSGQLRAFAVSQWRPRIFVSIGMLEVLSKKELEAVLFHELWHTHSRSSTYKATRIAARLVSPFLSFSGGISALRDDEEDADRFAVRMQGTDRFLESAREKTS